MKLYFSILLYTIFCFSHAYSQCKNLDVEHAKFINLQNTNIFTTPETRHHDILESISHANGYFAFYKTGPTEFLGNFANCPNGLYYQGFYFRNSEAAFQWAKFQLAAEHHQNLDIMDDPEMEKFFKATGGEAFQLRKKFNQKYKGIFPKNWHNGLRDQVMWQILEAKFQQNPTFTEYLLSTQPLYLLEHNEKQGRDTYWSDDFTGNGFNMLGKMLMAIRDGKPCPIPYDDSDRLERIHYAEDFNSKNPYHIF